MISIITPVLNGQKYIERCILSVEKLKIPYEHIIVDGGSIDDTCKIALKFKHIKLIELENDFGMYHAIDIGIRNAKFDIISYINCDDEIISNKYNVICHNMIKNKIKFLYADAYIIKSGTKKLIKGSCFPKFLLNNGIMPFIQSSTVFSKDVYLAVGGFDYRKYKICGDMDLYIKIFNYKKNKYFYYNEVISKFYHLEESLGNTNTNLSYIEKLSMNISNNIFLKFFAKIIFKINQFF
jgi:glycosyltransferase involved in cell wall biosynthesis